jgi:inward rectifier potassium channel
MRYLVPRQSSQSPQRIAARDGGFPDIERIGDPHSPWRDPYHLLLTISWRWFVCWLLLTYLCINAAFALAYLMGGDAIANATPGSFSDAFFFSVQTMASIGYGAMYPQTDYANGLVVVESFVGLLFMAMATGMIFARFSVPTSRILFSHYAVIAPVDGVATLMFRTANKRRNQILEAQLWVTLVRDEVTAEGDYFRRFYDLELTRAHTPLFALTWTAMHPIDEKSPLHQTSPQSLHQTHSEIIVILTGIDETISQTIHARHSFISDEILWDYRFEDILGWTKDGRRAINYCSFDQVNPLIDSRSAPPRPVRNADGLPSAPAPVQHGKNCE